MAAKKASAQKVEVLTRLDYEQCVEALRQFENSHPSMRRRKEFLGISVSMEAGAMAIKLTVTQLGEPQFLEAMNLPKDFDAVYPSADSPSPLARASLKVLVTGAPILTSAAPKSAAGKKTAPVFPTR